MTSIYQRDPSVNARGKCLHCGGHESSHSYAEDGIERLCEPDDIKRHAANVKRRARNRARSAAIRDACVSVGMRRVRGGLGGTYYE